MTTKMLDIGKTYSSEVLRAPPALVNTHIAVIDQSCEVGQGTTRQRAIAVTPFEDTDEPSLGVSLREDTSVAREAVIE